MNTKVSAVLSLAGMGALSVAGVALGSDAALMLRSYMNTEDSVEGWTPSSVGPPVSSTPSTGHGQRKSSSKTNMSD